MATEKNNEVATSILKAEFDVEKYYNSIFLQNGLPIAKNLTITNLTSKKIKSVLCLFSSEDGIIVPSEVEFPEIAAGGSDSKSNLGISPNNPRIMEFQKEGKVAQLLLIVMVNGEEILRYPYPITVLKENQWLGYYPYPELIASYIFPNADLVCRIQSEMASEIEKMTGNSALDGYQGGKQRVLEMCAALYSVVQKMGISYACPPASFNLPGQLIRFPAEIERCKLATCIESALLFAAVMERCSLYPVIIFTKNHCFVGCHLNEMPFLNTIVKDVTTLRNNADADNFVAIETTSVTDNIPFNKALDKGRQNLNGEDFELAVDVVRARLVGISPLKIIDEVDANFVAKGRTLTEVNNGELREVRENVSLNNLEKTKGTQGRIARWTQKLLDFSARNRLLNIPKSSKQIIPLLCADTTTLENKVAEDKAITIRSANDTMGDKAYNELIEGKLELEQYRKILTEELKSNRLCVAMSAPEVKRRLSDIYRTAKTEIEESGLNTLYLTIGSLKWIDSGANNKARVAPILMVPVELKRSSMADGIKMYRLDDDTTLNSTLVEFLRVRFNIAIPGLEPLPMDEAGVDVAQVMQIFREVVKNIEGWEVLEDVYLGCFSFGKFVMWKDMTDRIDELKKNKLVNHLIGGETTFDDGVKVFPPEEIANNIPKELYCPVSYDSSQLTAVLYSALGKSFVLHGPPGTGKSQTITNIIAHNLALGRRVLFVSEKKAALDVVKNRLDRIGLTPFCLELHSNKAQKMHFYEQVKEAMNVVEKGVPQEWEQSGNEMEKYRAELEEYTKELHKVYPNGLTAYNCFSQAVAQMQDAHPELFNFKCIEQSSDAYRDARNAVAELLSDFRIIQNGDAQAKMPELKVDVWTPNWERQLLGAVQSFVTSFDAIYTPFSEVYKAFGLSDKTSFKAMSLVYEMLCEISEENKILRGFLENTKKRTPEELSEIFSLSKKRNMVQSSLTSYNLAKLGNVDFEGIKKRIEENKKSFCIARFFKNRRLIKDLSEIIRAGAEKLTIKKLGDDLPNMEEFVRLSKEYQDKAMCSADEYLDYPNEVRANAKTVLKLWKNFTTQYEAMKKFVCDGDGCRPLLKLSEKCSFLLDNQSDIRNVITYRKTLGTAKALGIGAFADYIDKNDDGQMDILRIFDDGYAARMLDEILEKSRALAGFIALKHEERIEHFRTLNDKCAALAKMVIFAKLASRLPSRRNGPCPEGSELGILKRECEKKSRQKAVRTVLATAKNGISLLKPCFLMSPLSVAQYLPVDSNPFDLIVFDEASQIPVWDAIGVIARAKQLIVVGDPKQMPPTNFFQRGDMEEEDDYDEEEVIEDQESILDECLVAGVESSYLNWHYRSRHEALISFSNEHYYDNKLCTFPAASNSPRLGVKFVFVEDGKFDREGKSGAKVNKVEAEAIVDYVCNEVLKEGYKKRSIGIVTFNISQCKLIQTIFDERRSKNAELERLLPEDGEEAFFVKNLENVQGDERDVILFSVGYAPDSNGKFTMNFGPLNLSGGERRLNVAITRAKEQVIVFSSIHGSDIDAGEDGRTKAIGAGHLKAFLEYAESGLDAQKRSAHNADKEIFANTVANFLAEKGYEIDRDIGYSNYRIDIAVRDMENPKQYLMGIECDGEAYAKQRTAQDRDVNRIGVLCGLGWHVCRVWSADWALDRKHAEEHLLKQLQNASVMPAQKPKEEIVIEAECSPKTNQKLRHPKYKVWKTTAKLNHEDFYAPAYRTRISNMLSSIIATEAPIYDTLLRKRLVKAWGITRMTESVQRVLDDVMPQNAIYTLHDQNKVYWSDDVTPQSYTNYRTEPDDVTQKRNIDEIPPEELKNAMQEIETELCGCEQDELYRETLKTFALSPSLTAKARKYLDIAYALLKKV